MKKNGERSHLWSRIRQWKVLCDSTKTPKLYNVIKEYIIHTIALFIIFYYILGFREISFTKFYLYALVLVHKSYLHNSYHLIIVLILFYRNTESALLIGDKSTNSSIYHTVETFCRRINCRTLFVSSNIAYLISIRSNIWFDSGDESTTSSFYYYFSQKFRCIDSFS